MAQTEDRAEGAGGFGHFNGKSGRRLRCVQNGAKGAVAENVGGDKRRNLRKRRFRARKRRAEAPIPVLGPDFHGARTLGGRICSIFIESRRVRPGPEGIARCQRSPLARGLLCGPRKNNQKKSKIPLDEKPPWAVY